MLARGGVPEKSADFWGALQMLFKLSFINNIFALYFLYEKNTSYYLFTTHP